MKPGEIMNFPDVLEDKELNNSLTQVLKSLKEGQVITGVTQSSRPPAGVYWLLMHRDTSVRSWAQSTLNRSEQSIETMEDFELVRPVLENCLRVLEYEDFDDSTSLAPTRYRPSRAEFWTGLHKLLSLIEAEPYEEGIMAQFPSFLDLILNQIDTAVAWQTMRCLRIFFERLGGKIWSSSTFTPRFLANSLMGSCFRPHGLKSELVHKCALEALQALLSSLKGYEGDVGGAVPLKAEIAEFLLVQLQKCNTVSGTIKAIGAQIGLKLTGESFEPNSNGPVWSTLAPCANVLARMLGAGSSEMHHKPELLTFLKSVLWHDVKAINSHLVKTWTRISTGPPRDGSKEQLPEVGNVRWAEPIWMYLANSTKLENLPVPGHAFIIKCLATLGLFDLPHFIKLARDAMREEPDDCLKRHAEKLERYATVLGRIRQVFGEYATKRLSACDMETLFHQKEIYYHLTLLLLSPTPGMRQAVEQLFVLRSGSKSKKEALLSVAKLAPEVFVANVSAALKTLLELRPAHCFGSWNAVFWLCEEILPPLGELCRDDKPLAGAMLKLYLRIWTLMR